MDDRDNTDSSSDEEFDNFEKFKSKRKLRKTSNDIKQKRNVIEECKQKRNIIIELIENEDVNIISKDSVSSSSASSCNKRKRRNGPTNNYLSESECSATNKQNGSLRTVDKSILDIELTYIECSNSFYRSNHDYETPDCMPECSSPITCMIRIKNNFDDSKNAIYHWNKCKKLGDLLTDYAQKYSFDPERLFMIGDGGIRYNKLDTPDLLHFTLDGLNEIEIFETSPEVDSSRYLTLKWQIKGKKSIMYKVDKLANFLTIKAEFCRVNHLPRSINLVFDSDILPEMKTPEDLGMEENDCIDVYV